MEKDEEKSNDSSNYYGSKPVKDVGVKRFLQRSRLQKSFPIAVFLWLWTVDKIVSLY